MQPVIRLATMRIIQVECFMVVLFFIGFQKFNNYKFDRPLWSATG
jgi:hypothetical protein